MQTVISWDYNGGVLKTQGLDADQMEAAIQATIKMLNLIEDKEHKEHKEQIIANS